jgi:hypothetical protein
MADNVVHNAGHALLGTWRDPDVDGLTVLFSVTAAGDTFDVQGLDTSDGEKLVISDVRWDGSVLTFVSLVPSTAHRVEYEFETVTQSEVIVRFTNTERWVRVDTNGAAR